MAVRLNHTIVAANDRDASAVFLTEILGLPAPVVLGPFAVVQVGDTSLDYMDVREYMDASAEIPSQHYAFLVSESEFDEIFARIRERHLPYWADPGRRDRDQINTWEWAWGLLRRSERPLAGDPYSSVRQRGHRSVPTSPLGHADAESG